MDKAAASFAHPSDPLHGDMSAIAMVLFPFSSTTLSLVANIYFLQVGAVYLDLARTIAASSTPEL
jgi:hypothetical protein